MQLIRNCTGEIRAKTRNCDLTGCFCRARSCNCCLIGYFCRANTCNSPWLDNFGWRWLNCFWFSNAEFYFLCYNSSASSVWCNNFATLSLMCLSGSRDNLYLLTELTMFTDWLWNERHRILPMNLMKYALNFICFEAFWRGMPDSRMLSFWFLHCVFRVVELEALLSPPGSDILSSGIHKTEAHGKDFLHYYFTKKKCSCCQDWITVQYWVALLQLNYRNNSEITQHPPFYKKFVSHRPKTQA